jgi:hypothetical protein
VAAQDFEVQAQRPTTLGAALPNADRVIADLMIIEDAALPAASSGLRLCRLKPHAVSE